jgi:hypothetical protein
LEIGIVDDPPIGADLHQTIVVLNVREPSEERSAHDGECGGVDPDADGQRRNRDGRKARMCPQRSQARHRVENDSIHGSIRLRTLQVVNLNPPSA